MASLKVKHVPSLVSLCLEATKDEILRGDDILMDVYELPADLLDMLLPRLPPLTLQKLQNEMPEWTENEQQVVGHCSGNGRKRRRTGNFDQAWKTLFHLRWPEVADQLQPPDWQEAYWETHLQNCLDEAVELAVLPSFEGRISEMPVSDIILNYIGCKGFMDISTAKYSRLYQHCELFGCYLRSLRLQNVLLAEESCHLLRNCKLESLTLRWIISSEHVDILCKLLAQNFMTLRSIEFIHCKLSSSFVDTIFSSLRIRAMQSHSIQHLSVRMSSFLDYNPASLPNGFSWFLQSGRSLSSLRFSDDRLNWNFARLIFSILLDSQSDLSILDLSDNNIAGWLCNFNRIIENSPLSYLGEGKSLQSLHVLNLRSNNLSKEDADNLRYALVHMPSLQTLDISDNPIEDEGIRSLLPFFVEASEKGFSLDELNIGNCDISCTGVSELLSTLSTLKKSLRSLSIADNNLGSQIALALVKFMESEIQELNIAAIGLGSSGFQELQKAISTDIKLVKIDISKNRGGIETANFLSRLLERAKALVEVNASYNFMPTESLSIVYSALKDAKGNLQRLDLRGNNWDSPSPAASKLVDLQCNGKPIVIISSLPPASVPYDSDP